MLVACHFKNYFVIIYLLEDEQELSLGMLIHLQRIYNFWCSMLNYISLTHIFIIFLHHFGIIYRTNLLTRCPVTVSVYYVYALQKRSKIQGAQKNPKKLQKFYFARKPREPKGQVREGPTAPRRPQARPRLGRAWAPPRRLIHPLTPPLRLYIYPWPKNAGISKVFTRNTSECRRHRKP